MQSFELIKIGILKEFPEAKIRLNKYDFDFFCKIIVEIENYRFVFARTEGAVASKALGWEKGDKLTISTYGFHADQDFPDGFSDYILFALRNKTICNLNYSGKPEKQ